MRKSHRTQGQPAFERQDRMGALKSKLDLQRALFQNRKEVSAVGGANVMRSAGQFRKGKDGREVI